MNTAKAKRLRTSGGYTETTSEADQEAMQASAKETRQVKLARPAGAVVAVVEVMNLLTKGSRRIEGLLLACTILLSACAGQRRPAENANGARIKDSAPEKLAAQRAATPGLDLEDEETRWGISAAQERKRRRNEQDEARLKAASTTDIRATPAVEGAPVVPKP